VWQDNRHAAGLGPHGFDHVLDPGHVAVPLRRNPCDVPPERVVGPKIRPPPIQGERWISDDTVEGLESVSIEEGRGAQRVAPSHLKVFHPMKEHVHTGN